MKKEIIVRKQLTPYYIVITVEAGDNRKETIKWTKDVMEYITNIEGLEYTVEQVKDL